VYEWRRHRDDLDPYWVPGNRAAGILGVNVTRLNQLAEREFLPFEIHADATRLYRHEQLAVVANARDSRWRGIEPLTMRDAVSKHGTTVRANSRKATDAHLTHNPQPRHLEYQLRRRADRRRALRKRISDEAAEAKARAND
jgi:hypothetical protein